MQRTLSTSAAVVLITVIALFVTGGVAWTQTITGSILGTVTDPSANVIVGAKVTLTNEGTGDQRAATTSETGSFAFSSVLPGK